MHYMNNANNYKRLYYRIYSVTVVGSKEKECTPIIVSVSEAPEWYGRAC